MLGLVYICACVHEYTNAVNSQAEADVMHIVTEYYGFLGDSLDTLVLS